MYGGGSSGGLINIVTKKAKKKTSFPAIRWKTGFNSGKDHDENIAAQ